MEDDTLLRKTSQNPLANTYWGTLVRGALKSLEQVASWSMDWQLTAITKLLQSWVSDREADQVESEVDKSYDYLVAPYL